MVSNLRPIILCPLAVELKIVQRAFAARCEVHCSGPGAVAIERWFHAVRPDGRLIILAGVAGAVVPSLATGSAHVISRVIDAGGGEWAVPAHDGPGVTVASSDVELCSEVEKRAFAERTGADLVDQESAAFARCATEARCRWLIVRGISDDCTTSLPHSIDTWVDAQGRTRLGRVALSVARRPWLCRDLIRLHRGTTAALAAVCSKLDTRLNAMDSAYSLSDTDRLSTI